MADWGMYKPVLTALVLPPVPFLILILLGARLILPRRGWGYALLLAGVLGVWFSTCEVTSLWLFDHVLKPPPALLGAQQTRLTGMGRAYAQAVAKARHAGGASGAAAVLPPAAIIVLGSGSEPLAREYGTSNLSANSMARLRYGVWLSRQTGLPLGFSGGVGWAQKGAGDLAPEADVAARIAEQEFGVKLKWVESDSPDTRANAARTVALLAEQGVGEVVVVTHAFHMPRAMRVFKEAAEHVATFHPRRPVMTVTPASLEYWEKEDRPEMAWLPSGEGAVNVRQALRELLGLLVGA